MDVNSQHEFKPSENLLSIREPTAEDGFSVNKLVAACSPLDENSVYCNLLQCTHFAKTSCLTEINTDIAGFVSAYLLPDDPQTLFIWQVAIAASARNQGLARNMLHHILGRAQCEQVRFLQTTISPDNVASRAMFRKLADELGVACNERPCFSRQQHFSNQHDDEQLLIIGPLDNSGDDSVPATAWIS